MTLVTPIYKDIVEFFNSTKVEELPENLKGIWSLDKIGNESAMMSFHNAEHDKKNRRLIVRLYEPGNWLFNTDSFKVKYLNKWVKYSYQFDFNEDYTHAVINVRLGNIPIRLDKLGMLWTIDFNDEKAIRTTTIFGNTHKYESTRIKSDTNIVSNWPNLKNFFYC